MRIYSNVNHAFKDTQRSLWEMGIKKEHEDLVFIRPWIMEITDTKDKYVLYDEIGDDELKPFLIENLEIYDESFKEAFKQEENFLDIKTIIPHRTLGIEEGGLINRMLFTVNKNVKMSMVIFNVDLCMGLPLVLVSSIEFQHHYCKINKMYPGSVYVMVYNLHESYKKLESKKIF